MNTGRILAFLSADRVSWEDEDGHPVNEAIQKDGWVDSRWSHYQLYESRNDVDPMVDVEEDDDPELIFQEITDALSFLEGGFSDYGNNRGTFYATEAWSPFDEPASYSYALHFTRKHYGPNGWVEEHFDPSTIPAVKEWMEQYPFRSH